MSVTAQQTNTSSPPRNVAQVIPNTNKSIFCETFSCRTPASWFVGRPDGPRMLWHNFCQRCMEGIVANLPPELWGYLPEGAVQSAAGLPQGEGDEGEPEQFPCPHCDKVFPSKQALSGHLGGGAHKK